MNLVVGLGNPGPEYAHTRHNVGFFVVDRIIRELGLAPFVPSEKFRSQLTRLDDAEHHWFFAKPDTFMNASGEAVGALIRFYRLPLESLLIIHDDLDVPLGEVKMVFDRGSAGHNGVSSIIDALGGQGFYRLRIGIGSNRDNNLPAEDYVLQPFTPEEQKIISASVKPALNFILKWAK